MRTMSVTPCFRIVGANALLHVHRGEVEEQHRGGTHERLAQRHHRELEREAARLQHPALDALGQVAEVRVARRHLAPGVADADDRTPVEQVVRQALVLHPRSMHHAVAVGLAEPLGAAQVLLRLVVCHDASSSASRSRGWY
jgi:hypothetical protein